MSYEDIGIEYTNHIIQDWGKKLYLDNRSDENISRHATPFDRAPIKLNKVQEFSEQAFILSCNAKAHVQMLLKPIISENLSRKIEENESSLTTEWRYSIFRNRNKDKFELFEKELARNIKEKGQDNALSLFPIKDDKNLILKLGISIAKMYKKRDYKTSVQLYEIGSKFINEDINQIEKDLKDLSKEIYKKFG